MKTLSKILSILILTLFILGVDTTSAQYYRPHHRTRVMIRAEIQRPVIAIRAVLPVLPRVVVIAHGNPYLYERHDRGLHRGWYNPHNPHNPYNQPYDNRYDKRYNNYRDNNEDDVYR